MRHLTVVSSDELIDSLRTRVITNTIFSEMRSMMSWQVKIFFLLFITFRTHIRMSIIYVTPCSFLLALHLDCFLNTSVDKKIKCSFYISKIVFHFSLWLKLSIFFCFGSIFSWNAHWKQEKANREKIKCW